MQTVALNRQSGIAHRNATLSAVFWTIFWAALSSFGIVFFWETLPAESDLAIRIATALTIPVLGYYLWTWYKLRQPLFMPFPIFLVALYVYHFGQYIVNMLGYPTGQFGADKVLNLFRFPDQTLHSLQLLAWVSVSALQVGGLLALSKFGSAHYKIPMQPPQLKRSQAVLIIGLCMVVVSIVPACQELYNTLIFRAGGTLVAYTKENTQSSQTLSLVVSQALFPGLLFVASGAYGRRWLVNAIFVFSLIWFALNIAVGDRSSAVQPLIATLWTIHVAHKKFNTRLILIGALILCFVVNPIVALVRNATSLSSISLNTLESTVSDTSDFAVLFFDETGISAIPAADTLELVPDKRPFGYGYGYIENVVVGPVNYFFNPGSQGEYGVPAYWLIATRYPERLKNLLFLGFSPIGEAFIEFGYLAPLVMAAIGYFLVWGTFLIIRQHSAIWLGAQAVLLSYLVHFARGDTSELGRPIFRYVVLPICLMLFIESGVGSRLRARNKNKKGRPSLATS